MYRFLEYTVGNFMTREVVTVSPEVRLWELESLFERHDFNTFPVLVEMGLVGIVTKFDFLKMFAMTPDQILPHYDELMERPVADAMTVNVVHVSPEAPLTRALQLMIHLKARSFPVVTDKGRLVGMIAREDLMRALQEATRAA